MTDLGTVGTGTDSKAQAINTLGQLAGYSELNGNNGFQAVLFSGGGITTLRTLGGMDSSGYGINDSGQVVGYAELSGNQSFHAFLWTPDHPNGTSGSMTDLRTLGGTYSAAYAVNASGQAVGYSNPTNSTRKHAFRTRPDAPMTAADDLGTLPGDTDSYAYGINTAGEVVGYSVGSNGTHRAFLYSENQMTDLNNLLPASSGWTLTDARAINDAGQIVGYGLHNGQPRAFRLDSDIVVDDVRTTDARSVTVTYDVNSSGLADQFFEIGIFRAPTDSYDPQQDMKIGSIGISGTDIAVGHHTTVPIDLGSGMDPNLWGFHYVLAVADPNGQLSGFTIDNSRGHFRTYVIGAVVPGYYDGPTPAWVPTMADKLMRAGYDDTISFPWASNDPDHEAIYAAAQGLATTVDAHSRMFSGLQPNDVIDVHLIGHSRGAVLVGLALPDLLALDPILQLQHGFMKMTLLDTHPANNAYSPNEDINPDTAFPPLHQYLQQYQDFQAMAQDPGVTVPARVNEAEILWQHTPYMDFFPRIFTLEYHTNLWGLNAEPPSRFDQIQIDDPSSTRVNDVPLTSMFLGSTPVGHQEVHEWYQAYYIPGGPGLLAGGRPPLAPPWIVSPGDVLIARRLIPAVPLEPVGNWQVPSFEPAAGEQANPIFSPGPQSVPGPQTGAGLEVGSVSSRGDGCGAVVQGEGGFGVMFDPFSSS